MIRVVHPGSRIPDPDADFLPSRIPDPTFFHPGSRIRTVSIPDPGSRILKEFKYFNPKKAKKWFLSSKKYDPGCSSRIPDPWSGCWLSPIPDPGSRGQKSTQSRIPDPQHWKKLQLKKKLDIFLSQIAIYPSKGLHKGRRSNRRSLQPSKENIKHIKTWNFLIFSHFCGPFWHSWIRIPIPNTDPDPILIRIGSGSETLKKRDASCIIYLRRAWQRWMWWRRRGTCSPAGPGCSSHCQQHLE